MQLTTILYAMKKNYSLDQLIEADTFESRVHFSWELLEECRNRGHESIELARLSNKLISIFAETHDRYNELGNPKFNKSFMDRFKLVLRYWKNEYKPQISTVYFTLKQCVSDHVINVIKAGITDEEFEILDLAYLYATIIIVDIFANINHGDQLP